MIWRSVDETIQRVSDPVPGDIRSYFLVCAYQCGVRQVLMVHVNDLAAQLGMTFAGVRYRITQLHIEPSYDYRGYIQITESQAEQVRNFKNDKLNPRMVQPFLDELRAEMSENNVTGMQVAVGSGISQSMVTQLLNGKRKMKLEHAERLASALGLRAVLCTVEVE